MSASGFAENVVSTEPQHLRVRQPTRQVRGHKSIFATTTTSYTADRANRSDK